MLVLTHL